MPVSGVTTGDPITEAWGDSVASSIAALEAAPAPYIPGGTDVAIADGGTGASSAAAALTNLGAQAAATAYKVGGTDVAIADGGTGASTAAAAATALGVGATSVPAFQGVAFPAADVPNAGVNVLDDYEEGTFTPQLSYVTPGNGSWAAPSIATGFYTKIGNRVFYHFIYAGSPTNGTAAGNLQLSGLPFAANAGANTNARAPVGLSGFTKAGYTTILGNVIPGGTIMNFLAYGSGVAAGAVAVADIPSAGAVSVSGSGSYIV